MLVISIFSAKHHVSKSFLFFMCLKLKIVWYRVKGYRRTVKFKPFPNKPWSLCVCSTSLLKPLWEKENFLVKSNFSFSHSVFYPFEELSAIFIKVKIVICKLSQFEICCLGKGY